MPNWTSNEMVCHKDDLKHFVNESGNVDFGMLIPMPDSLHQTDGSITQDAIDYVNGKLAFEDVEHYLGLPKKMSADQEREFSEKIDGTDENGRYFREDVEPPFFCKTVRIDGKNYFIETIEQFERLGEIYLSNKANYGAYTWYHWAIGNWGTKWNACNTSVSVIGDYAQVYFQTAWSTVSDRLMQVMQERFSHPFYIECVFEDEQDGAYCPMTEEMYEGDEARLFEKETEIWDDEEYVYMTSRILSAEDIADILGE